MTRDEYLHELQRRIAERKGYTDLEIRHGSLAGLHGVLYENEGPTHVPRWPWDWCDAGVLVNEMRGGEPEVDAPAGVTLHIERVGQLSECTLWRWGGDNVEASGSTIEEAIARCWCAWKGVDLADLPPVAP